MPENIIIYDTTLRDGTQGEQINLSAEDKFRIAQKLDEFGIHYVEGGWPASNPKDTRFFQLIRKSSLKNSRMVAFGSTHWSKSNPQNDTNLLALLKAETKTVAIVGKSWDFHVRQILNVSLDKNLAMIEGTLSYLNAEGREVIYHAEHFFDGYIYNPAYALATIDSAINGGAYYIVLCDTNGGTLTDDIRRIVTEIKKKITTPIGIHAHNDCGLALANSLIAIQAGAKMIQGTINGYGERCGNADLIPVIANLHLKMGYHCILHEKIKQLTELSRFVSDVANVPPLNQHPFVGKSAFSHKGGIHVSAIQKAPSAYEHIDPSMVGNHRRVLVSDLSGKSNVEYKARELGIKLPENGINSRKIVSHIKNLEDQGYQFDAAEGSLELLFKKLTGQFEDPFTLEAFRVIIDKNRDGNNTSQATIKISVGHDHEITAAEGDGPVNALDNALRKALIKFFPQIQEMGLVDFKVRVIEGSDGTAAKVRVQIDSRDAKEIWSTIGVSENIIEASWQALVDSVQYKLLKA